MGLVQVGVRIRIGHDCSWTLGINAPHAGRCWPGVRKPVDPARLTVAPKQGHFPRLVREVLVVPADRKVAATAHRDGFPLFGPPLQNPIEHTQRLGASGGVGLEQQADAGTHAVTEFL